MGWVVFTICLKMVILTFVLSKMDDAWFLLLFSEVKIGLNHLKNKEINRT